MAKLMVQADYDKVGKTLTIWFDDPSKEFICEETGDEVVLMKDKDGRVIGFERLNYVMEKKESKPRGIAGARDGHSTKKITASRDKSGE